MHIYYKTPLLRTETSVVLSVINEKMAQTVLFAATTTKHACKRC